MVIENTMYKNLTPYDEKNNEIEINIDFMIAIRNRSQHIRTGVWFQYSHMKYGFDLSNNQIFRKDQLDGFQKAHNE
jgi:hypothetical protein